MRGITLTTAFLLLAAVAPAAAQQHDDHDMDHPAAPTDGPRAEWIQDIDQLEEKYTALAGALEEHWAWRPGEGVRSVGELFGHVANANFMFPTMVGIEPEMKPEDFEKLGGPATMEGLSHSFMHARHAISEVSDEALDETTTLFGREATKRQVLTMMVTHMHEHLGQAIAYARTNGVAPPWSGGGE
jgi:uncharacterized damage-inducible protein DinB